MNVTPAAVQNSRLNLRVGRMGDAFAPVEASATPYAAAAVAVSPRSLPQHEQPPPPRQQALPLPFPPQLQQLPPLPLPPQQQQLLPLPLPLTSLQQPLPLPLQPPPSLSLQPQQQPLPLPLPTTPQQQQPLPQPFPPPPQLPLQPQQSSCIQIERDVKIVHGDCIEGIRQLPPSSVDLVIADPPYNIAVQGSAWDTVPDYLHWSAGWLKASIAALRAGGSLFLYGSPAKLWITRLTLLATELGLEYKQHISWVYKRVLRTKPAAHRAPPTPTAHRAPPRTVAYWAPSPAAHHRSARVRPVPTHGQIRS